MFDSKLARFDYPNRSTSHFLPPAQIFIALLILLLNVCSLTVPVAYSATETFTFDANGNLATWTDANGTVITHSYDTRNRLTNKAYASNKPIGSSGNADGLTNIAFTYDANGNITQSTETYAATPADTSFTRALREAVQTGIGELVLSKEAVDEYKETAEVSKLAKTWKKVIEIADGAHKVDKLVQLGQKAWNHIENLLN